MNDSTSDTGGKSITTLEKVKASLGKRRAAELRFQAIGLVSIMAALLFLVVLLGSIVGNALPAFTSTYIGLDVYLDPEQIDPEAKRDAISLAGGNYDACIKAALARSFPNVKDRSQKRALNALTSSSAPYQIRDTVLANPGLIGQTRRFWLLADDTVDQVLKGGIKRSTPESERKVKDHQLDWMDQLSARGQIKQDFNVTFLTSGDSREPESAGILGALSGSFLTLLVTISLSLPIGMAAAIYLEEFAPKNGWTDFIEVNINNLAAVPSIVFGLLGLAVFINFMGITRSSPLVGGLILTLMTMPVIIIAGRSALKSVPPSVRDAALGVGASPIQAVFHHVFPLAMPGMLTGAIIGLSRALGESAPLLMIGMVAFIVDVPEGIRDPATVLPVQIYLWADSPERAFVERTSAAILVLLAFLVCMNGLAVYLRKKYERRW
jgi:phosphate transport system permease protein